MLVACVTVKVVEAVPALRVIVVLRTEPVVFCEVGLYLNELPFWLTVNHVAAAGFSNDQVVGFDSTVAVCWLVAL